MLSNLSLFKKAVFLNCSLNLVSALNVRKAAGSTGIVPRNDNTTPTSAYVSSNPTQAGLNPSYKAATTLPHRGKNLISPNEAWELGAQVNTTVVPASTPIGEHYITNKKPHQEEYENNVFSYASLTLARGVAEEVHNKRVEHKNECEESWKECEKNLEDEKRICEDYKKKCVKTESDVVDAKSKLQKRESERKTVANEEKQKWDAASRRQGEVDAIHKDIDKRKANVKNNEKEYGVLQNRGKSRRGKIDEETNLAKIHEGQRDTLDRRIAQLQKEREQKDNVCKGLRCSITTLTEEDKKDKKNMDAKATKIAEENKVIENRIEEAKIGRKDVNDFRSQALKKNVEVKEIDEDIVDLKNSVYDCERENAGMKLEWSSSVGRVNVLENESEKKYEDFVEAEKKVNASENSVRKVNEELKDNSKERKEIKVVRSRFEEAATQTYKAIGAVWQRFSGSRSDGNTDTTVSSNDSPVLSSGGNSPTSPDNERATTPEAGRAGH